MLEAILAMLIVGSLCAAMLVVAAKVFYVEEDPRVLEVEDALPGANCGGCGFAGCSAAAAAIVEGRASASICVAGGSDTAEDVARIMGVELGAAEPIRSYTQCFGGLRAAGKYDYLGVQSCRAAFILYGGEKECGIGCLGFGDCVRSCQFGALRLGDEGYPVVDLEKCVGCGACERVCPKGIIKNRKMSERLLHFNRDDECLAPCRQTCPAEINIPMYIHQIRIGDYKGAVDTIRERNPLLLTCGRVCPHPCEPKCRRGIADEPVAINYLKRFVADVEMNSGRRYPISMAPPTQKKVAVVGGGPAGLSCAYFLRRIGHEVTIYEAMPKLGGMLRYGIPEYRLPKKVLDWEIQGILDLGIEVHTNVRLGRDFTVSSLVAAGYDAIFLGLGAWRDTRLRVEGEDLDGCYTGIQFLGKVGLGEEVPVGRRVAVIGGGNTAIDCARTLLRLGAEEVTIVYRRTRKEMPANELEIVAAEEEGVKFHFLSAPVRVIGDDEGKVRQLEYLKMKLGEPDQSGRRRPEPIEGSETLLDVDMIITAIGQSPDVSFMEEPGRVQELQTTRWNTIVADPRTLQTNIPYLFAAGDVVTGPDLVVGAIGTGRRAARSIHQYLMGEEVRAAENELMGKNIPETLLDHLEGIVPRPRAHQPELPVAERIHTFDEVELTIDEDAARAEADRCLFCGLSCYNIEIEPTAAGGEEAA